jgi:hypothetical protein
MEEIPLPLDSRTFPFLSYQLLTSHNYKSQLTQKQLKAKVKVALRLAVYRQSVRLGVKPLETHDQRCFFFN